MEGHEVMAIWERQIMTEQEDFPDGMKVEALGTGLRPMTAQGRVDDPFIGAVLNIFYVFCGTLEIINAYLFVVLDLSLISVAQNRCMQYFSGLC